MKPVTPHGHVASPVDGLVVEAEARAGDGPRLGQAGPISTMRRSSA